MNATVTPSGHALIEYTARDAKSFHGAGAPDRGGVFLFGPGGELLYPFGGELPPAGTDEDWRFADWLRDILLQAGARPSGSERTPSISRFGGDPKISSGDPNSAC